MGGLWECSWGLCQPVKVVKDSNDLDDPSTQRRLWLGGWFEIKLAQLIVFAAGEELSHWLLIRTPWWREEIRLRGSSGGDSQRASSPSLLPQHTELLFQRYQSTFIHTLDVGRQLFSMGDEGTQNQLQADLGTLQEEWDNLQSLLGRRTDLTEAIIQVSNQRFCSLAGSSLRKAGSQRWPGDTLVRFSLKVVVKWNWNAVSCQLKFRTETWMNVLRFHSKLSHLEFFGLKEV